jgi:hypothetical protein
MQSLFTIDFTSFVKVYVVMPSPTEPVETVDGDVGDAVPPHAEVRAITKAA